MKCISPTHSTTYVINQHTWRPKDFNTFSDELNNIKHNKNDNSALLYRGHKSANWKLDSTFIRYFKKEILKIPKFTHPNDYIRNSEEYNNAIAWFYLFKFGILARPSDELEKLSETHGIDSWFELMKIIQQDPREDHPEVKGTNIIDWTKSSDVALYFSNENRNDDGALWICDSSVTGKTLQTIPVGKILDKMKDALKNGKPWGCPLLFCPKKQIKYNRAKHQEAIYISQMDLRYSLDELWNKIEREKNNNELIYMKLILSSGSENDFTDYLLKKGITPDYLFPNK
ncbi:FRG domain-containing protein [Patescibacteria group bacterium]|nr:FRG domain-containing protein [Patescibacteria group bacterium]MBU4017445.1 FRG domain-containing protein [Patescibacteria group bacterium]MBU4098255.1 FRG domain-containing protein [Patescibacteria group bacterium]